MNTKQITKLNNNAIALLQAKNYKQAAIVFADALRVVQTECKGPEKMPVKTNQDGCLEWAEQDCEQPEGTYSFIYSRPLTVSTFATSEDRAEVAAAIMFNMALSIHLRSCELGAKGAANLKKTLSLYQHVREIMSGSPFLETAILFNAGLIHQELFDFNKAQTCFQLSEEFLFSEEQSSFLYNNDRKAMILNVTTFQEPELAAAA